MSELEEPDRTLWNDDEIAFKEENSTMRQTHFLTVIAGNLHWFTCLFAASLLPSFVHSPSQAISRPPTHPASVSPPQPVSFLLGLRGFASTVVFIFHFAHGSYPGMDHAYGHGHSNHNVLQLPFVRIFYAADAMVALFFAISGYVLSYRCVKYIRRGDSETLFIVISSLTFRRAMRLYLPAVVSSLLAYLAQRAGWMPTKGLPENYVASYTNDTQLYLRYLGRLLDIWAWNINFAGWWYNPQLWSIPVEFRCSLVLFLYVVATARCKTNVRLFLDATATVICMLATRWDVALFVMGKLIAEVEAMCEDRHKHETKPSILAFPTRSPGTCICRVRSLTQRLLLSSVFLLGVYLLSYPKSPPQDAPMYSLLSTLANHDSEGRRVYYAIGAALTLLSVISLPALQTPFESSIAKYMGRISFALYLTHGLLIRVVGSRILRWAWTITGTGGWSYDMGFGLTALLLTPLVVWSADLFEGVVGTNCIDFAKWVEGRATENTVREIDASRE
ncbi:hypothetical protein MMC14_001252 [Varicellaria rhodocarpa]|nr:hypothetical protein [Varicellaria rhodocarpa]